MTFFRVFETDELFTVLFTKPLSSILPAIGMTIPAAGLIHGLREFKAKSWNSWEP